MVDVARLRLWQKGVWSMEDNDLDSALEAWQEIYRPDSRLLFNLGCLYLLKECYRGALEFFNETIIRDSESAIAYFQRGVCHFLLKKYKEALADFTKCENKFRTNQTQVDYSQIGLRYKLQLCEVNFNKAMVLVKLGQSSEASVVIKKALECKKEMRHAVIDAAVDDVEVLSRMDMFVLPNDAYYKPPKSKVAQLDVPLKKETSKLVSAIDENDQDTGFTGPQTVHRKYSSSAPCSPNNERRGSLAALMSKANQLASGPPPKKLAPRKPTDAKQNPQIKISGENGPEQPPEQPPALPPRRRVTLGQLPNLQEFNANRLNSPPSPRGRRKSVTSQPGRKTTIPVAPPTRPAPRVVPPPPPNKKNNSSKADSLIMVDFHCGDTRTTSLKDGSSLADTKESAANLFHMDVDDFDIWYETASNEQKMVTTESEMTPVWKRVQKNQLQLWCYGKS